MFSYKRLNDNKSCEKSCTRKLHTGSIEELKKKERIRKVTFTSGTQTLRKLYASDCSNQFKEIFLVDLYLKFEIIKG